MSRVTEIDLLSITEYHRLSQGITEYHKESQSITKGTHLYVTLNSTEQQTKQSSFFSQNICIRFLTFPKSVMSI